MKVTSPCLYCTDRYVGCHSKCNKFKEYREALDDIKRQKQENKEIYLGRSRKKWN